MAQTRATSGPETYLSDPLPQMWQLDLPDSGNTPESDRWWDTFGDTTLQSLISRAVKNNFNAQAALHRIESARQICRATKGGYFPQIATTAGWSRQRSSADMQADKGHASTMSYFNLGLSMNWEIDLFGRIHSQSKADKANYEASVAEYDATLVSLCANLAKAYFSLRMAQAELAVADSTVANAEELLHIANKRYEVGLVPGVDPIQARMVVTRTRSTIPTLKQNITEAINEIAVLIGEYPDTLTDLLTPAPLPDTPAPLSIMPPRELLRRRPDIVKAEKELAYYAALVGVSKKDFLPTLSLSAGVGTEAHNLKDIFGAGSLYYQIAPTLSWTIFEGMIRGARVAEAKAAMLAQIDTYNITVMTAVQEVNNAMAQYQSAQEIYIYNKMLLKDSLRELELQTDRYRQGLCDFSDVADAQTSVLQYEDAVIESHASQLAAFVTIYTALGGGW